MYVEHLGVICLTDKCLCPVPRLNLLANFNPMRSISSPEPSKDLDDLHLGGSCTAIVMTLDLENRRRTLNSHAFP